jgi:hypothetical protein
MDADGRGYRSEGWGRKRRDKKKCLLERGREILQTDHSIFRISNK